MDAWAIVVYILFPIPLVFLLILCLLPNFARKWATKVMDLCLFPVILGIQLQATVLGESFLILQILIIRKAECLSSCYISIGNLVCFVVLRNGILLRVLCKGANNLSKMEERA